MFKLTTIKVRLHASWSPKGLSLPKLMFEKNQRLALQNAEVVDWCSDKVLNSVSICELRVAPYVWCLETVFVSFIYIVI